MRLRLTVGPQPWSWGSDCQAAVTRPVKTCFLDQYGRYLSSPCFTFKEYTSTPRKAIGKTEF